MRLIRSLAIWVLLSAALAPAGAAAAETRTFLNTEGFGPSEDGGTIGPATHYPGTVNVAGVPGTVARVTLTAIELNAGADLDMALVGPNGAGVVLMSDACRTASARREIWTFADDAPIFVPQLSCTFGQTISVRPTDYEPEYDNFGNSLSAFNGISPNGDWRLFMIDDSPGVVGFEMSAFALHLEVEPPPPEPPPSPEPPAPIVQTVFVPVPATAPAPAPAQTRAKKTGKRAAALARCKLKKTKAKRVTCRAKARKLPV